VLGYNSKIGETIYGKPSAGSTCDALHEMVYSNEPRFTNDPYIQEFRERLKRYGITRKSFMRFVRWLYNQFSDKAAHEMSRYAPSLPEYNDVKAISEMLKCVEIDKDIPALVSIQIILEPFSLPSREVDASPEMPQFNATESTESTSLSSTKVTTSTYLFSSGTVSADDR